MDIYGDKWISGYMGIFLTVHVRLHSEERGNTWYVILLLYTLEKQYIE